MTGARDVLASADPIRYFLVACPPASIRTRCAPGHGEERDRLWQRWVVVDSQLDTYAGRRSTQTPVVVLESRDGTT